MILIFMILNKFDATKTSHCAYKLCFNARLYFKEYH